MSIAYAPGTTVRLSLRMRNQLGALAEPSALTLTISQPGVADDVYTDGVDSEIVDDGTGLRHFDLTVPSSGEQFTYAWVATGTVAATFRRTRFINHGDS